MKKKEKNFKKIIVVMPAYNAEFTLERTYKDIPDGSVDEIILTDDASSDKTVEIAKKLGITTICHKINQGYGANQKTCYDAALEREADIVIMIHPDYQYDSRLIPFAAGFIEKEVCDVVIGSRIRTRGEVIAGGMPIYKYLSNRFLTIIENIILGQNLGDFHSGFRAYSREVLETIPYHNNSSDFVFDTEFLAQVVYFGFKIGDIPVPCRYFEEASYIAASASGNGYKITRLGFDQLPIWAAFTKTFLESYWIATRAVIAKNKDGSRKSELFKHMTYLGQRFHKLGVINHLEAVSRLSFENALRIINEDILAGSGRSEEDLSRAGERLSKFSQRLHELSQYTE